LKGPRVGLDNKEKRTLMFLLGVEPAIPQPLSSPLLLRGKNGKQTAETESELEERVCRAPVAGASRENNTASLSALYLLQMFLAFLNTSWQW
jgi:hypothetical protein